MYASLTTFHPGKLLSKSITCTALALLGACGGGSNSHHAGPPSPPPAPKPPPPAITYEVIRLIEDPMALIRVTPVASTSTIR